MMYSNTCFVFHSIDNKTKFLRCFSLNEMTMDLKQVYKLYLKTRVTSLNALKWNLFI